MSPGFSQWVADHEQKRHTGEITKMMFTNSEGTMPQENNHGS